MMGYGGGYGYGMMGYGWGWLMMIGIFILMVLGIIALIRYLQHSARPDRQVTSKTALNILNERYARGEMSEEEYKAKKAEITK
jgi:putative membrane protein